MSSEDQNLGIVRDGFRGRAPCQGNLGIAIGYQVLLERGHLRVGGLRLLCLRLPPCAQHHNQCQAACLNHYNLPLHEFLRQGDF